MDKNRRLEPGTGGGIGWALPEAEREWTFMVYMAGDNSLEAFGNLDLAEMKQVGSSPLVAIVAQFDRMQSGVTRRYYLQRGTALEEDQVGPDLGETNTGDPRELARFLAWAMTEFPAKRHALVIWNHGVGWKEDDVYSAAMAVMQICPRPLVNADWVQRVAARSQRPVLFSSTLEAICARGIAFDDTSSDFLDNSEMKRAIDAGLLVTGAERLTVLGFDACLMNMIEVTYQVKSLAHYLVGSQETEPGEGWPYGDILRALVSQPTMDGKALAACIVDTFVDSYEAAESLTLSALDLDHLLPLTHALDELCSYVMEHLEDCEYIIGHAVRRAQKYADADYKDLYDLCRLIVERSQDVPELAQRAQAVMALIVPPGSDRFVLSERHEGYLVGRSHGISIYFPARGMSPFYRRLDFASETLWDDMLHQLLGV